jgi:hypothetical protein
MTIPSLTLRSQKGTALTHAEMDSNLNNLASANVTLRAGSTSGSFSPAYDLVISNTATIGASVSGNILSITNLVAPPTYTFSNTATLTLSNVAGNISGTVPGTTFTGGSGSTTINPGATLSIANSTSIGSIVSGTTITFYDLNPGVNIGAGGVSLDSQRGFSIANTATVGASLSSNIFSISAITVGTAGTYQGSVTTDVYGRITAGSNGFTANVDANQNWIGNLQLNNATFGTYAERTANVGPLSGTVTLNANTAPIQTAGTTGNITINTANLSNFAAGESVTLILRHNGSPRTFTSDIKFVNSNKTIGGNVATTDVITIFYDGVDYLGTVAQFRT